MNDIEFRVWDTKKQNFVSEFKIVFSNYGDTNITVVPNSIDYIGDTCYDNYNPTRFKIMRYTGLKDYHNKKIYEGDLIKLYYVTPFGNITTDLEDPVRVIEFSNGTFGYKTETKFTPLERLLEQSDGEYVSNKGNKIIYGKPLCKIVGNLYENVL